MTTDSDPRAALRANFSFRRLAPSILLSTIVPVLLYELLRTPLHNSVLALAIGAAVPVVWTLGRFVVTRRVDPIGLIGVFGFGVGLLVAWLSGGNPILLELRDALPSAVIGLAFLVAMAFGKPLTAVVVRLAARNNPRPAAAGRGGQPSKTTIVLNVLIGVVLLVHSAALTVLALSVSLNSYVALSRPVGWGILGAGILGLLWLRKRAVSRAAAIA